MTLASRYKSAAAAEAIECLKQGERHSDTWTNLYGCGYRSLFAHCSDQDRFTGKCNDLVDVASSSPYGNATHDGKNDRESLVNECKGFLGALDANAVADVEKCVREQKFPVYSCVEGLDAATKDRICVDPNARQRVPGMKETCERLISVSSTDEGILNRDSCLGLATRLRAAPANAFLEAVSEATVNAAADGTKIGNYDVTQIAGRVIRDTCRNTSVDAACVQLVDALKSSGMNNNGGRLTKECRQLFSALDAKGADQIQTCSRVHQKLARTSPEAGRLISLYWCMSDLKAYPSELQ
jgi:hypothetical protein